MNQQAPYTIDPALTAEEATRQWWQQRFGQNLPEDVKVWLRQLTRREIMRAHVEANVLDDAALQRVREGRRLCQTKLANVEEALQRTRQQQDLLRRFLELTTELEHQRAHLYEVGKRQASVLTQQRELERFEAFEPVNGRFQRIHTLAQAVADARNEQASLAADISEARRTADEAEKRMNMERQKLADAQTALNQAALVMTEAERLGAQVEGCRGMQTTLDELHALLTEREQRLRQQLADTRAEAERLEEKHSAMKLRRQSLDPHTHMILRGEALMVMLDELLEAHDLRQRLTQEYDQALRRQNERNEQLGRLFVESQNLDATIKARQEEIDAHRRSTAGQDSFSLQRRALELQNKKMMLQTGFTHWRNIAIGYDLIEQGEQRVASLRLRADHLNRIIDGLQADVHQLRQQLRQKTYHWTLSKSQNVIELRADLDEGTPCTVCGATHHPWQGEGIAEQSALISSLKADCENLERELQVKQKELEEKQLEFTALQGKLEVENATLRNLVARQSQDTDEWRNFAPLDRSLTDCSRSTNREARTTTMRQLIEKTTVDAEAAEKELNTFTFHRDAISTIGGELQQLQRTAADLAVRVNEVNTACQVMAGQVERTSQRLAKATTNYSQRYEALEREITIPDWFAQWKDAPESIKLRVQDMMKQWSTLSTDIARDEERLQVLREQETLLQQALVQTQTDLLQVEARTNQNGEQLSKTDNTLTKLLPDSDGKTHYQQSTASLAQQQERTTAAADDYGQCLSHMLRLEARRASLEAMIRADEERMAQERSQLDLWMRRYNASNPPVQFAELERVLTDGTDWTDVRLRVHEIAVEQAVTQARVEHLRAQIIALQAEGVRVTAGDGSREQESLRRQQEELEKQRREILQQTAQFDLQLRAHEQAQAIGHA